VKVLVVGGGGREHALCRGLAQDPAVSRVFAAPGNPGIADVAECFAVGAEEVDELVGLVDELDVDLTVVGPEAPLVAGLADALRRRKRAVFGPSAAAARIEGSKAFAKDVMARRGVPTARSGAFEDAQKAVAFVDELGGAAVVKADGLAGGKGVTVATDRASAVEAIERSLGGAFGEAGRTVVVEEVLEGPEISVFVVTDGTGSCVLLDVAQDHKRARDGDVGPNTGGMGAFSPVPSVSQGLATSILETVMAPVVDELRPYVGVLYAGLMLTDDGPKVLEFNCRFGDPEAEVLLPRMPHGVGTLFDACARGRLAEHAGHAGFDDGAAVSVVIASAGYPGASATGKPISGIEEAASRPGAIVYQAATARDADGRLVTAGGRVLAVTGTGSSLAEARDRAYGAADAISFDGAHARRDIASRAVQVAR
jgi:phosphoribosylamine---glycine ligase